MAIRGAPVIVWTTVLPSDAPSDIEQFRRTAGAVDKILRGAKPADLPVEEPVRLIAA
jgi:putative ABC transport system substrate-binding protein